MEFINLSSTASTLLITLYSRAAMSKRGMILEDKKAEEIISLAGYDQKKLKVSMKLQALLTLRAYVIDEYTKEFINRYNGNCNVIQIGCGLDSRYFRINNNLVKWYDLDLYGTMEMRKKYFKNSQNYKMISSNVCNLAWLNQIDNPKLPTLVIAEGLFMYLTKEENKLVLDGLSNHFKECDLICDAFSTCFVKASRHHVALKRTNASMKFGYDDPSAIENISNFKHVKRVNYYHCPKVNELPFLLKTRFKFRKLFKLFNNVQRVEIFKK